MIRAYINATTKAVTRAVIPGAFLNQNYFRADPSTSFNFVDIEGTSGSTFLTPGFDGYLYFRQSSTVKRIKDVNNPVIESGYVLPAWLGINHIEVFPSGIVYVSSTIINDQKKTNIWKASSFLDEPVLMATLDGGTANGVSTAYNKNGKEYLIICGYTQDKNIQHNVYLSQDGGETFTTIKTTMGIDPAYNWHWHCAYYDDQDGKIWIAEGDDPSSRGVWYSSDLGVTWTKINSNRYQPTLIFSFADKVFFGRDYGKPGLDSIRKADLPSNVLDFDLTFRDDQSGTSFYPIGRQAFQSGKAYIRFSAQIANEKSYIYGTGDNGNTWHKLFESDSFTTDLIYVGNKVVYRNLETSTIKVSSDIRWVENVNQVANKMFQITVDTTKAGSADNTFVLPTVDGTNYANIHWGDGTKEQMDGSPGNITHVYPEPGVYQISIDGAFVRIYFNNAGDKLKLLSIDNWGVSKWGGSMNGAFFGCANMEAKYSDSPYFNNVTDLGNMFRGCAKFNGAVNFNTANVKNFVGMFNGCVLFNQSVLSFNTSKATTISQMFYGCSNFNQPVSHFDVSLVASTDSTFALCSMFNQSLATWNTSANKSFTGFLLDAISFKQDLSTISIVSATSLSNMLLGSNINESGTTTNYDALLLAWANGTVPQSLSFHAGTSKYNGGLVDSGTANASAANKLIQSGKSFLTTVNIGDVVHNASTNQYTRVLEIDSDTQLSIETDIIVSGQVYNILGSDVAKAKVSLMLDDLWTIVDGRHL